MVEKVFADTFEQSLNKVLPNVNRVLPAGKFGTVGDIVSELASKWLFPFVGILLLFFLISGGFDLMTSAGDPKKTEAGKEKITAALVGFLIVFAAFWIYQIVKFILGIETS